MSQTQGRIPRVEVSRPIPEEDEDSDSAGSDQMESVSMGTKRRPSRLSFSKLWKFSVLSVDPSPRVSTIDGPVPGLGNVDAFYNTIRISRNKLKLCCCSFTIMCITTVVMTALAILFTTKTIDIPYCTGNDNDHVIPRDMYEPDIYDDLTVDEYRLVTQYLLDYHHLGLVQYDNAILSDNYIFSIELLLPDKEEALQYIDEQSKQPDRKAKAVIYRGNKTPPVVEEYIVSPLHKPNEATYYKNPSYRRHPIPFNSRPMDNIERQYIYDTVIGNCMSELHPLLLTSYNLSYHNCTHDQDCIELRVVAPYAQISGDRMSWFAAYQSVDAMSLHPLGLRLLVRHEGTNTSKWSVEEIIYNGQSFPTSSALMDAFLSESLAFLIKKHPYVPIKEHISPADDYPNHPEPKQGPFLFEPSGKRFSVIGQRIVYKTWSFYYHLSSSNGIMLFDIKFNNVRIAYELSLQDAIISYYEQNSRRSNTSSFDLAWLFGSTTTELVRGIDCPESAVFISSNVWSNFGKVKTIRNNICVFENNGAIPLERHYAMDRVGSFKSYSGLNNYHLIIRTIMSIGTNDYVIDYIFHINGVIDVRVSVSGNIKGSFRTLGEEQDKGDMNNNGITYGNAIGDSIVAHIHTHLLNFKVDLDVAGTSNRFSTLILDAVNDKQGKPEKSHSSQLHLVSELKEYEGLLDEYNYQNPQHFIIHNYKAIDTFESNRAYRILNKSPLFSLQKTVWTNTMKECVKFPIFVTKRKDFEQTSTSLYSVREQNDPVMSISDFVNGESIVDTDLVAWVTIGHTHIPGTEDVPVSPPNLNQMSFTLAPHNYFTHNPTSTSGDLVVIHRHPLDATKTVTKSQPVSSNSKCVPKALGPFDSSFNP